jgi:hypothetical protein
MGKRIVNVVWYAALLGLVVILLDKVFGGMTGGLKKGLGSSLGI